MRNQRLGVRSTKSTHPGITPPPEEKKRNFFTNVHEPKGTMYKYQRGNFTHQSSRGNSYKMILHEIDGNSTWIEPMKKRQGEIILDRRRALERMKEQGIVPTHQVLDNEISAAYILEIKQTRMTFHLVPPDDHLRNLAEKSIHTWMDHLIGVMSGTAAAFPAHLWYQSIPQAERQLLILRQSNLNPKISAYAHVYGPHNYNGAPCVPNGMETLVHNKMKIRGTFAEHCSKGFVLGT